MRNIWIVCVAIVTGLVAVWFVVVDVKKDAEPTVQVSTSTEMTTTPTNQQATPEGLVFVRPDDFGLAVNPEQVLVTSYIPPCTEGFEYCLYYNGDSYTGTNFESAGLSVRTMDAQSREACESTDTYNGQVLNTRTEILGGNQFSVFESGDAGAGHMAQDTVYRTFTNTTCFELVARIGSSQFLNYEPGTIKEFTDTMRSDLRTKLENIVSTIEFQD